MAKYCFQSQYLERKIQSIEASSANLPLAVLEMLNSQASAALPPRQFVVLFFFKPTAC